MTNMTTEIVPQSKTSMASEPAIENALIQGDLSGLTPEQRISYYNEVCGRLGLNALTKPFDYLRLNNKLLLYARKECSEQLRRIHKISRTIVERKEINGVYVVTARAT